MKQIFITGICGFVGSSLAYYFQSLGYKVYGIDNLSRKGSKKNFKLLKKKGVIAIKGDLTQYEQLKLPKRKTQFEALIHCAALTSVLDGVYNNSSEFLYKNNLLSTIHALQLCNSLKSKFIHISSSRIYGISEIEKLKLKVQKTLNLNLTI